MRITNETKEKIIADYKLIEEQILTEITELHNDSVAKFIIFPFVSDSVKTYSFCNAKYSTREHKVISITAPIDYRKHRDGSPIFDKYGNYKFKSVTIEL